MKRLLTALLLAVPLAAVSQELRFVERLLATHPADDLHPALSPDGKWLIWASQRDDLSSLYRLELGGERLRPPEPFAQGPGRSHSPVFSPDGKQLAFVSTRRDALGDILLLDYPSGDPEVLTERGRLDRNPFFSADGSLLIFESETIGGNSEWRAYNLETERFLDPPAEELAFNPEPPFPVAAADRLGRAALLYSADTNADGYYRTGDNAAPWILQDGEWKQVAPPLPGAESLARDVARQRLIVAASYTNNLDLGEIAANPLNDGSTPADLATRGNSVLRRDSSRRDEALAYFAAAARRAQEPGVRTNAMLELVKSLNRFGRYWEAQRYAEQFFRTDLPEMAELRLRAQYLRARYELAQAAAGDDLRQFSPPENLQGQYQMLLQQFLTREQWEDAAEVRFALARMHFLDDDYLAAAQELGRLLEDSPRLSQEIQAQALLFRAELYDELGLGQEMTQSLLRLFALQPQDVEVKRRAANQLIQLAMERGRTGEEQVLQLRSLVERAQQFPYLSAKIRLAEAQLLRQIGRDTDALIAYERSASFAAQAPAPAMEAASQLASLLAELGRFDEAVAQLQSVRGQLSNVDDEIAQASFEEVQREIEQFFLRKGRAELRLGDPLLALATFNRLLETEPASVEGWRGKIQALSTQPQLLEEAIDEYDDDRKDQREQALAHYKYGLALSYVEPASKKALRSIERAISLEPAVPFYYLTQGFVLEQQYRDDEQRGRTRYQLLEEALTSYRQAMALTNRERTPQLYADLLLNTANTQLLLQQFYRAAATYARRDETAVSFPDRRTAMLYHWNWGLAAYRSDDPVAAAEQFAEALELLEPLRQEGVLEEERVARLEEELTGRRALALMDADKNEEAERLFTRIALANPENSLARIRAERNRAILLERAASRTAGGERATLLRRARARAKEALRLLEHPNIIGDPDLSRRSSLITLDIAFTTDATTGGADLSFDVQDERRLLHATLGRIAQMQEDHDAAVANLEEQLDLQPELTDGNRAYYLAARSVTLSRMAAEAMRAADLERALQLSMEGLSIAKFMVAEAPIIDPNGASRHLLKIAEVAAAMPETPDLRSPEAFWMLDPESIEAFASSWEILYSGADRLVSDAGAVTGDPSILVVQNPQDTARLQLARAMAGERLVRERLLKMQQASGIGQVREMHDLARSLAHVEGALEELKALAQSADRPREIFRYAALALGIELRVALLADEQGGVDTVYEMARQFLRETGQSYLLWFLDAQLALHHPDPAARIRHAELALTELEEAVVYQEDAESPVAWPLYAHLEAILLRERLEEGDAAGLWNLTERWRCVRLALLAEGADPVPVSEDDRQWLDSFADARAAYADLLNDLRSLPMNRPELRADLLDRMNRLEERFRDRVQQGREFALPTAAFFAPKPMAYEEFAALFETPALFPGEPLAVVNRLLPGVRVRASYGAEGTRILSDDEEFPESRYLFAYGEESGLPPERSVMILNGSSFFRNFESLSFNVAEQPLRFPEGQRAEAPLNAETIGDLRLAYALELVQPAQAWGRFASYWIIGESDVTLRRLLEPADNLEEVRLPLSLPSSGPEGEAAAKRLSAAALLDQRGVVEGSINGRRWIGVALTPDEVPEAAAEELAAAEGTVFAAIEEGDTLRAIPALERAILIREALGRTDDLELYYVELAQARAKLGRFRDASRAAERRLELLRSGGGAEAEYLASAISWRASFAADARQYEIAEREYRDAIERYRGLGLEDRVLEVQRDLAITQENAGRFAEAYSLHQQVLGMLENQPEFAINQRLRLARIARIYLNRYEDAERHLQAALEQSRARGLVELEADAMINLSRVTQRQGLFTASLEWLDAAERIGERLDSPSLLAQVALERANVYWFRSEYFESFGAQQRALRLAEETGDPALEIAILNVAGLTSWSVNDLVRALEDLERALTLAERENIPSEVATTANNLGLIYRSQAKYEDAMIWLERALATDQAQSNQWGEAYAQRNIGITHTLAGRPQQAVEPLLEAVELSDAIGDDVNHTKALLALAEAHEALEQPERAREYFEAALEQAGRIPLPEVHWRSLYGLGRLQMAAGDLQQSAEFLDRAIAIVDGLRAAIRIEELQDGFLLDKQDLYDTLIAVQLKLGQERAALQTSERSRGRNFVDLLGNRQLNLAAAEDEELLSREQELRSRVERLERQRFAAGENSSEDLVEQLEQARREYSDFLILLRANNPQLANFVRVEPIEVQEIQALLAPDVRLAIYHLLEREVVIWVVGPESVETFRSPRGAEELTEAIRSARTDLQDLNPVEEQLTALSAALIEPILPSLQDVRFLGIVPHRELHTLPFAALPIGGTGHLINRVSLFYAPTASVLEYTIARRPAEGRELPALAVGNPEVGDAAYRLPFAEKEAQRLRFNFPALTLRIGEEATETWITRNLQEYGIVHIASHGEYQPDTPLFSAVLLAPDQENDGVLTAQEVFGLQMRADLVALSACQSGLGQVSNGDDIVGLNRAFVYAGTRQLLTTLWRVDDISTAVLFKHFYRNLEQGMTRAEALRRAQLLVKDRLEYQHPAHWAGLVLSGDWQ